MLNYISQLPSEAFAASWPRRVVILGSTGSIGKSALSVIAGEKWSFKLLGLAGGRNFKLLAEQAEAWRPACLAVADDASAEKLREAMGKMPGYRPEILIGPAGYAQMAALPEADLVLSAQSGAAGLGASYAAVKAGKVVALANKESLILAGDIIRKQCRESGASLLPVDSEHNAIFQCLMGHSGKGLGAGNPLKRVILTASGGPFLGRSAASLAGVSKDEALAHPTWNMGVKITIDSATLMNKGMEYVEACHLFGLGAEQVEVLVHPQSIVHSLVEYGDNSRLAQLGVPDMRIPIACCLGWPRRIASGAAELDLTAQALSFQPPDLQAFPALRYWQEAHSGGRGLTVALNAANEVAVEMFMRDEIDFTGITRLAGRVLENWKEGAAPGSIEDVLAMDKKARILAGEIARLM